MLNKGIFSYVVLITGLFLVSCTPVVWENPIAPVEETEGDPRLPGAWGKKAEELFWIGKPVDGWMSFAFVSDEKNKNFGKMYATAFLGRTFLHIRMVEDGALSPFYYIVEYEIRGKKLFLFLPDKEVVEKEFETKKRSQAIEKIGEALLLVHASTDELRDFIQRSPKEKLFVNLLDQPDHLIKLR